MKIKEQIERDVAILTLSGSMMGGPETASLHEKIKSLIADDIKKVIIDLKDVKWMNSSAIGTLMACYTSLNAAEGHLKLASVSEKIESLLIVTRLIKLFDHYESAERALAAFYNV